MRRCNMSTKILITVIGFNALFVIFVAGIVVVYLRPRHFVTVMSVFLGWLTGFINLSTSEVQFPILLLLAFGFFLGFTHPKGFLKHSLILGVFVPVSQVVWIMMMHREDAFVMEGLASLFAFVPAFVGTYGGRYLSITAMTVLPPVDQPKD